MTLLTRQDSTKPMVLLWGMHCRSYLMRVNSKAEHFFCIIYLDLGDQ